MSDLKEIFYTHFAIIDDTRCQCDVKYPLMDVLILITCAIMCGEIEIDDIVDYGDSKSNFLKEKFDIKKTPSRSTIIRILNMIDAEVMSLCTVNLMKDLLGLNGDIVAIDGKTICSTAKMNSYKEKIHILTAMLTENGVCLGQISVNEKTNEIPCMIELLDLIKIENKVITADAMHCQTDTVKAITEKGCDYVLGVKKNQKTLYEDIELMFKDLLSSKVESDKKQYETAETTEKNRTRYEKRKCYLLNDISWLDQLEEWGGLKSIFAVERIVKENGNTSKEMSYYISSAEKKPEEFLNIAREHWKIESMHWFLDVVMKEDECRVVSANGLRNLNVIKKFTYAMHKNYTAMLTKKTTMKRNAHRCLLDDDRLIDVIKKYA